MGIKEYRSNDMYLYNWIAVCKPSLWKKITSLNRLLCHFYDNFQIIVISTFLSKNLDVLALTDYTNRDSRTILHS